MPTGYLRAAEGELFGGDPPLDNPGGAIFRQFTPSTDAIFDFLVGYRARCLTVPRFLLWSKHRNLLEQSLGLYFSGGSVRTASSHSMLMQRHPHIKTIRLYPYVLGCILDGFTCGEPSLPGAFQANEAFISALKRRGRSQGLAAITSQK